MRTSRQRFRRWATSSWEGVVIAVAVLRDNRIRSALTILGVGVAVMVVVAFGALIAGVRTSLADAIEPSNPESFEIRRIDPTAVTLRDVASDFSRLYQDRPGLTPEEADLIESLPGVEEALFGYDFGVSAASDNVTVSGVYTLAREPSRTIDATDLSRGRDFTPSELAAAAPVVLVTRALVEDLFDGRDALGRSIRVNAGSRGARVELRIVGILDPAPNLFTGGQAPKILALPYTTAERRLGVTRGQRERITVIPAEGVVGAELREQIEGVLRLERGLGPRDESNFTILDNEDIVADVDQLFAILFLVVVILSSAGLLVGGIGVVGIMLISVTERTREIGIRKAIGARRSEILWQFLVEAGLLTGLGGAAGLVMGAALAEVVASLTPVPAAIPFWSVVVALLGATLTGILFGLLPALRASRLEPVEALRAE